MRTLLLENQRLKAHIEITESRSKLRERNQQTHAPSRRTESRGPASAPALPTEELLEDRLELDLAVESGWEARDHTESLPEMMDSPPTVIHSPSEKNTVVEEMRPLTAPLVDANHSPELPPPHLSRKGTENEPYAALGHSQSTLGDDSTEVSISASQHSDRSEVKGIRSSVPNVAITAKHRPTADSKIDAIMLENEAMIKSMLSVGGQHNASVISATTAISHGKHGTTSAAAYEILARYAPRYEFGGADASLVQQAAGTGPEKRKKGAAVLPPPNLSLNDSVKLPKLSHSVSVGGIGGTNTSVRPLGWKRNNPV